VCDDPDINRKVARLRHDEDNYRQPVHHWLGSKFDRLTIDLAGAEKIIATLKRRKGKVGPYRQGLRGHCERIASKDFWLYTDPYGRVHTPITSLKRELRSCLLVNGKPLVDIDLKCSQPLLLGVFARKYYSTPMERHRLLAKTFDDRRRVYCTQ